MALERLPVATGGPAITRELRAHRGPEQPAIRDRLPGHIDGHSRGHLHPRPAGLHLPATLLRARRDDERHQITPTPAREPTPPRTLRPCRHEIDPRPRDPAPDPNPDPAPERSTVALSGFSALKTPITQRSSPSSDPSSKPLEQAPRASPSSDPIEWVGW